MERYTGVLTSLKYIMMNYAQLSWQACVTALFIGCVAAVLSIVMLRFKIAKKYASFVLIVSILPFLIGLGTSLYTIREVKEVSIIENQVGKEPSAKRYYDKQYGYSEAWLYLFPFVIGLIGSVPAVALWTIAVTRRNIK